MKEMVHRGKSGGQEGGNRRRKAGWVKKEGVNEVQPSYCVRSKNQFGFDHRRVCWLYSML